MLNLMLTDPCPRCGGAECFDGPLCEDCTGMVIMGLALLGEYGEFEKQETIVAIRGSHFIEYRAERMRLIQAAKIWG